MPRRRAPVVASLLAVALLSPSVVMAQTTTTDAPPREVTGRLLDAKNRPLARQPVILNENRGIANDAIGVLAFAFSLGLSCVARVDPCRNSGSARVDTDSDGRFSFDVAAVQKARGRSRGVVLVAGDAPNDGAVSVRFNPAAGGDLGALQLWDPALRITTGSAPTDIRLQWTSPPGADSRTKVVGSVTDMPRTASQTATQIVGFSNFGTRGDMAVDGRALEDLPATLTLAAGFSRPRANQNPRVDWLSAPERMHGAGPPLSRGAPCVLEPGPATQGCRLTDGDLLTAVTPPPQRAIVDLGKPLKAAVVAVRPKSSYTTSISADGVTWKALAAITRQGASWDASLFAADGPAWRYARIEGVMAPTTTASSAAAPASAATFAPAEVSVWPPAATLQAGDNPVVGSRPSEPRMGEHHRIWLVVLAIALLAVGCLAAGVAIARRRPGEIRRN